MKEIIVRSSLDKSSQPNLFHAAQNASRPLLVGLHAWSADRFNQEKALLPLAQERDWNLLLPEFRGPNLTSNPRAQESCGSILAKQDILNAIESVRADFPIGPQTFLIGGSGGGHMALLLAAFAPQLWTVISSWCPITSLRDWHGENSNYRAHIEACCGGAPDDSDSVTRQYLERSPISHLDARAQSTLCVHHGKDDTSVPWAHTQKLWDALVASHPQARVYCEIFPGGHEIHAARALAWFDGIAQSNEQAELSG